MALSNRKLTKEDIERCGVSGGGGRVAFIKCSSDEGIVDGTYDFINAQDGSVIEPATNAKVVQAIKNGIVYVVAEHTFGSETASEIASIQHCFFEPDGKTVRYAAMGFAGSGVYDTFFTILEEEE